MSKVAISYDSLKDASTEAKNVAKKLGDYEDAISRSVYNKLNSYSGSCKSDVNSAKSYTGSKIKELQGLKKDYEAYATDLTDLKTECQLVDKAVRGKVSALTASFKQSHGIRDSKIENAINFFLTDLGNKTAFGRFLGNVQDDFDAMDSAIKDHIKKWYNYEGGKELVTGALVGILEVVGGVIAVVLAIGTLIAGGTVLAMVAAAASLVLGVIGAVNGLVNIVNEQKSYSATQNGDPARGKRRSDVNTLQDYLRSSFYFGDSGEYYEYDKGANFAANLIDGISLVCTAITFVSGMGELCKKGFKWATGRNAQSFKEYFSKNTFNAFKSKFKTNIINGFTNIKTAFRTGNFTKIKEFGKTAWSNFGKNFEERFFKFDSNKDTLKSIKNMIDIPKSLLSKGFNLENIAKTGWKSIVLPCVSIVEMTGDNGKTSKIVLGDLTKIFTGASGLIDDGKALVANFDLDKNVMEKFSVPSDLNISVPDISVPQIEMPVLRVA